MKDYKFTISVENSVHPDYISEKFMNAIAFNTVPIYYGGKNISYDTLTKTLHEYELKYNDKFQELVHLDKNNTNTDDFIFNKEPEKTFILSLPTKKGSKDSEYIKNKEKTMLDFKKELKSLKKNIDKLETKKLEKE